MGKSKQSSLAFACFALLGSAGDIQTTVMAATTSTKESGNLATAVVRSEDVLGQKWDKCLVDSSIKLGTGLVIGSVFSLLLFKRKMWPITFGLGAGFGMGYANCQNDINKKE